MESHLSALPSPAYARLLIGNASSSIFKEPYVFVPKINGHQLFGLTPVR